MIVEVIPRDLGERLPQFGGNANQCVDYAPVTLVKSVHDGMILALLQPSFISSAIALTLVLAAQQAAGERAPGADRDSQFLRDWKAGVSEKP